MTAAPGHRTTGSADPSVGRPAGPPARPAARRRPRSVGPLLAAPSALLLGATAVPLLATAALVLFLAPVNTLVGAVGSAAEGVSEVHDPHLSLWHGVTAELLTTVAVLALGLGTLAVRRTL